MVAGRDRRPASLAGGIQSFEVDPVVIKMTTFRSPEPRSVSAGRFQRKNTALAGGRSPRLEILAAEPRLEGRSVGKTV